MQRKESKDKKYGKYDDYEIESAARTIIEAEEIKADYEKMKYVKMCLEEKNEASNKAIKSLKDMRDAYKNMKEDKDDY